MTSDSADRSISVVIPCHNYGRFMGEALESVDSQDLQPNEIIICDDGSTDDSLQLIRELTRDRPDITVVSHERALGLVPTLNELFSLAKGTLIVPLSSDDRLGPNYVSSMARAVLDDGYDFAYCNARCFGAEDWLFVPPAMDPDRLARFNFIHGSSGIRKTAFELVGGYHQRFNDVGFEDYDFWISAVEAGLRGVKVENCELEWRRHSSGSRNTATRMDRLRLRWMLFRYHPSFFLHPRSLKAWLPSNRPIPGVEAPP